MQKKQQSIWTTDITPHVVNFMTMDITPDFSSEFWQQDITHHVIGTMAMFGLVVSALVATAGVATVGVQTEVAFAQQASAVSQTAALAMGDTQPASAILLPNANSLANSPVAPLPQGTTIMQARPMLNQHMGSSIPGMATSSPKMFCLVLKHTVSRGANDATTSGDVGQLQQFIANHFGLNTKDVVTGFFGSTTQHLVQKFQQEQGIGTSTGAGPLTRAAIARLCNPSGHDPVTTKGDTTRDNHLGSTSPMIGSTTPSMPPMRHDDMRQPPMPPKAATTMPVSYNSYHSSNSAAAIEAINEISDGYGKLFSAAFGFMGL